MKDFKVQDNFPNWIEHFNSNSNLMVYQSPEQPSFLQFHNRNNRGIDHVKLYVSYPKEHMYNCVNKIFDYISINNMPTLSKVSRRIRSDSIVLRMGEFDDAIKVVNFINNDPELNSLAKETNPFLIKNGKVGMAYDDMLSYNSTLAMILSEYFNYCKANNLLSNVSMDNFKEYTYNYYKYNFKSIDNLKEFTKQEYFEEYNDRFNSVGEEIVNYENVIKLIMLSLEDNISIDEFRTAYNQSINYSNNKVMASYYNQAISSIIQKENEMANEQDISILNKYIDVAIRKYGVDLVPEYLNNYISGNINAITREENLRELFKLNMSPKKVWMITNGNIPLYIKYYLNNKIEQQSSYNQIFIDACLKTYTKYGYNQLYQALISGTNGEYKYFTNDDNCRTNLIKYINREEFLRQCHKISMGSNIKAINEYQQVCEIISNMAKTMNENIATR